MELNLPMMGALSGCQRVLIAGMGGGFDLFCGLPIAFELRERGYEVHLANLSFSYTDGLHPSPQPSPSVAGRGSMRLSPSLVGVTADDTTVIVKGLENALLLSAETGQAHDLSGIQAYFPELYLARWLREQGMEQPIWCFSKTGARPLAANYQLLIDRFEIDALILVDGGVDSLMHGNEDEPGTFIEDSISLAASHGLAGLKARLMACIGLGAELDMRHTHVFEHIAELTKAGGFLGSCALVPQMRAYQLYEQAVLAVQAHPGQEPSVINSSVVSAVRGEYGNYHLTERTRGTKLWISPLMALYWCFDAAVVAAQSQMTAVLAPTESMSDAIRAAMRVRNSRPLRKGDPLPLR